MESSKIYNLLRKKSAGNLTKNEQLELDSFRVSEDTRTIVKEIEFIMSTLESHSFETKEISEQEQENWQEIEQVIESTPLSSVKTVDLPKSKTSIFSYFMYAAAAIAVLVAALIWLNSSNIEAEYITSTGNQETFRLLDGSVVTLNGKSKLTIEKGFGQDQRRVLLEGEGYFDIEKDELAFVVKSNHFTIKVLGTVFNIMDYKNEYLSEVNLEEGSIQLHTPDGMTQELSAGQNYSWNTHKITERGKLSNSAQKTGWQEGVLIFRKHELRCVFRKLEHYYGIKIDDSKIITDLHYTNTFTNQEVDTVLDIIAKSAGIRISEVADGEYLVEN